jgi:mannosylfructose-phosphate synthase
VTITQNTEMTTMKTEENICSTEDGPSFKRIAMISTHGYVAAEPPLGAPDTGGQVVYVLELSKVLGRLGYHVDIFTRQFEEQSALERVDENVQIIRIPCGGSQFITKEYMVDYIDEWAANALQFIKENNKEYIFVNSHYWDAGIAGRQLSRILNIPHLHTPHSVGTWKKKNMEKDYSQDKDFFEKQYNFSIRIKTERELFHSCYQVVATTPIQEELIMRDYNLPKAKITMIPPGYDDNKFYPMADASMIMLKEKFHFRDNCILALSRLAHNKGLDLLVESFGILCSKGINAQLVLAVGHEERNELEEEIYQNIQKIIEAYHIGDKVRFLGFIPDEELAETYLSADVFVLSSRYEPFGMTAVEAMACGTPTIVTKHGGLCRELRDGTDALISDPFNTEQLADDMATILRHEGLRNTLSQEGSKTSRDNFSWTGIALKLASLVKGETVV